MPFGIKCSIIACAALLCLLELTAGAFSADFLMKGPPRQDRTVRAHNQAVESSCVKLAFESAIRFYKETISPVGGVDRCGFTPSCSTYAYEAISEQGPWIGIMMAGDRLTRCNIWKKPGMDYTLLPNGKLYDPPHKNVLRKAR